MNILFRDLSELAVNLSVLQERVLFFQNHYYDNIYYVDSTGNFQGSLRLSTASNSERNHLLVNHRMTGIEASEWFKSHPGIYRLPLVIGNRLLGEYYDADSIGPSLYKMIEDKARAIRPLFEDSFQQECGHIID